MEHHSNPVEAFQSACACGANGDDVLPDLADEPFDQRFADDDGLGVHGVFANGFGGHGAEGAGTNVKCHFVELQSAYDVDVENPVAQYNYKPQGLLKKFEYYVLEFSKKSYIKRVIGIAGDHVKIENGKVYLNGEELDEPYLKEGAKTEGGNYLDIIVPEGYVFAMGDNREHS